MAWDVWEKAPRVYIDLSWAEEAKGWLGERD